MKTPHGGRKALLIHYCWLRTGIQGKNVWSSSGLTHTATQLERDILIFFLGQRDRSVEAPVPKTSSVGSTVSIEL